MFVPILASPPTPEALAHLGTLCDVRVVRDSAALSLGPKGRLADAPALSLCHSLRGRFSYETAIPAVDETTALLDAGALSIEVPVGLASEELEASAAFASQFPRSRLVARVPWVGSGVATETDAAAVTEAVTYLRSYVGGIAVECPQVTDDFLEQLQPLRGSEGAADYLHVLVICSGPVTPEAVGAARKKGIAVAATALEDAGAVIMAADAMSESGTPEALKVFAAAAARCFVRGCVTDRPDGLFASVVCDELGVALGLVYSSEESVIASVVEKRGIYFSRSRGGLWRKGDSSGAVQLLRRLDTDCDGDALRFLVVQRGGAGEAAVDGPAAEEVGCGPFCHCGTRSCWGDAPGGLGELQRTLYARRESAPEGSYTKRLFDDPALLRNKLLEEAQELIEAEDLDHVAAEAADVVYFAMTRMAAKGATLAMTGHHLDRRSLKVKRRPGNAKAYRIAAAEKALESK